MRLESHLVLNRYLHGLFGARELTELKQPLNVQEGRAADGQSYFYGALLGRVRDAAVRDRQCGTGWRITMPWMGLDYGGQGGYLMRLPSTMDAWHPVSRGRCKVRPYAAETGKIPSGPEGSSGMPGLRVP